MTARLEQLVKLKEDVMRRGDELRLVLQRFEDLILGEIIEERDRIYRHRVTTGVAGMPCVAEITWPGDDEMTQPVDASDSSAAIPSDVIEKLDRCAE